MSLTAADLEALPARSAVLRNDYEVFIADDDNYRHVSRLWGTTQSAGMFSSAWVAEGRVEVLWRPTP